MSAFFDGFEKQALLGRTMEDIVAGGTSMIGGIPGLGATALHSFAGDRPEGHSHLGEFAARSLLSSAAGSGAGALAAKAGGKASIVRGVSAIGRALGGVAGSRLSTGSYYGEQR